MDESKLTPISLSCWGRVIEVCASEIGAIEYIASLKHISGIPLAILGDTRFGKKTPSLHVIPGTPASLTFNAKSRLLALRIDWTLVKDRPSTLTNLLGQLLALACSDDGEFPIHAAAVSKEGKAYLLIGGPGAGKTNLSVLLCKNYGFKWLSNDWCTLTANGNNVEVVRGYDLINFRQDGFDQVARYIPPKVTGLIRQQFLSHTMSEAKSTFFTSDELGLMQGKLPRHLGGIFFIEADRAANHYCRRIPPNHAIDLLLREIFWPLRGLGSFVIDNSGKVICPSLVLTPNTGWESMCHLANTATAHYPCYIAKAPLEVAADFVRATIDDHNLPRKRTG